MKKSGAKRIQLTMNRRILYSVLIAVAVTVILLSGINSVFLHNTSMDTALNNYSEINRLTGKYVDEAITNAEKGINRLVFGSEFQRALLRYEVERGIEDIEVLRYNLKEVLANSLIESDLYSGIISNVIVFDTEGRYIASMRDYRQDADISGEAWKSAAEENKGRAWWVETHKDANNTHLKYANVISVAKMLYSTELSSENPKYGQCIGYVLVHINEQDFAKLYIDMAYGETGRLCVINEEGIIISDGDKTKIGETLDPNYLSAKNTTEYSINNGRKYILSNSYNKSTGWMLAGMVETKELTVAAQNQWLSFAVIAVVIFILIVLVMNYASKRITKPLAELQDQMKKVEQGNFSIQLEKNYSVAEIDDLIHGFGIMVKKLDELVENVYESGKREQQLKLYVTEARLKLLQNQMNPHFLYNTLDAISWLASLSGQDGISRMVNSLGEILRASVKMDTFVSNVEVELNLLKKYLYIQNVRHGDKLAVSVMADESVYDCEILKFMLQPFVENAIVHGIKETGEQLSISIKIEPRGEYLVSEVSDNGRGMDARSQEQLFKEKESNERTTGTGCVNVFNRLNLVYPERFFCEVKSIQGRGSRITIKIPLVAVKVKNRNKS